MVGLFQGDQKVNHLPCHGRKQLPARPPVVLPHPGQRPDERRLLILRRPPAPLPQPLLSAGFSFILHIAYPLISENLLHGAYHD
jgi:hypothetical protein